MRTLLQLFSVSAQHDSRHQCPGSEHCPDHLCKDEIHLQAFIFYFSGFRLSCRVKSSLGQSELPHSVPMLWVLILRGPSHPTSSEGHIHTPLALAPKARLVTPPDVSYVSTLWKQLSDTMGLFFWKF